MKAMYLGTSVHLSEGGMEVRRGASHQLSGQNIKPEALKLKITLQVVLIF